MNNNKCCDHCENQQLHDVSHEFMAEVCKLELGTIYRCEVCGTSWMKSANRGWLLLRVGNSRLKMAV